MSPTSPDYRFPKSLRLRTRGEFLRVQRGGRRRGRGNFVVVAMPATGPVSRLGITASRKAGNAVVRNRIKRRVREFFRHRHHAIHPPLDIVVIALPQAAQASYAEIVSELSRALAIAGQVE